MKSHRFDALTKTLAGRRLSRRTAVAGGAASLAATGLAGLGLTHAIAQDSTPAATPDPLATDTGRTYFLFVQTFHSGSLTPHATEAGMYILTVTGGPDQTIYFSDRPDRIVGTVPTTQFLDGLGFPPGNPPNAALVAQTEAGEEIVVVELLNPVYTERFEPDSVVTLTYDVRILEDYQEDGLAHLAAQQGEASLPEVFGAASLFIDDCADHDAWCQKRTADGFGYDEVGHLGPVGYCWNFGDIYCHPCRDYDAQCNATFPDCQNACSAVEYT